MKATASGLVSAMLPVHVGRQVQ
ncbi:hypothetical protein [Thiolapillus sp.]